MLNDRPYKTRKMKTPSRDLAAETIWLGYEDVRAGRSFPREYDGWRLPQQRNYEWGRGLAAAATGALGSAPAWPRNRLVTSLLPRDLVREEWRHHRALHA